MKKLNDQTVRLSAKECQLCHSLYFVSPCRTLTAKFCSRNCQLKGQGFTEGRKRKIGNANRGQKRPSVTGIKNHNWAGGDWKYWNRNARQRDLDTCQCISECKSHIGKKCGFSDSYIMHVDHIKPKRLFPELALKLENLLTLCPNCHQHKTNKERRLKLFKNVGRKKYV